MNSHRTEVVEGRIAQLNCQAEIERLGLLRDQMEAQLDAIAVQAKTANCN